MMTTHYTMITEQYYSMITKHCTECYRKSRNSHHCQNSVLIGWERTFGTFQTQPLHRNRSLDTVLHVDGRILSSDSDTVAEQLGGWSLVSGLHIFLVRDRDWLEWSLLRTGKGISISKTSLDQSWKHSTSTNLFSNISSQGLIIDIRLDIRCDALIPRPPACPWIGTEWRKISWCSLLP